jgi:hypothetical protein
MRMQALEIEVTGVYWRYEDIDENAGTGDRSDMRKQGIGENTGTGDRSATDIFVGYR